MTLESFYWCLGEEGFHPRFYVLKYSTVLRRMLCLWISGIKLSGKYFLQSAFQPNVQILQQTDKAPSFPLYQVPTMDKGSFTKVEGFLVLILISVLPLPAWLSFPAEKFLKKHKAEHVISLLKILQHLPISFKEKPQTPKRPTRLFRICPCPNTLTVSHVNFPSHTLCQLHWPLCGPAIQHLKTLCLHAPLHQDFLRHWAWPYLKF